MIGTIFFGPQSRVKCQQKISANGCVTKNCNFWTGHLRASKQIGSHVYPIDMMYYSFRSAQMPHSKVLVFCNETKPWNFLLTFDATLGSKKYGANYLYPHVSYIFGKPWACSSTWCNLGWVIRTIRRYWVIDVLVPFVFLVFLGFQHRAPVQSSLFPTPFGHFKFQG